MTAATSEVQFYRATSVPPLEYDKQRFRLRLWTPELRQGAPGPEMFMGRAHQVYLAFHKLGIFASRDYCAVCVDDATTGETLHVSTVFPKYFRFPFMAASDLQVGATFTKDSARGQGLATAALNWAAVHLAAQDRVFWYLTETSNAPSCRVARAAGFSLAGTGFRRPVLGLRVLGKYVLERPADLWHRTDGMPRR